MAANDTPGVDGRRRTWIKADVFFYSGLGQGLRERFGLEGVVCFDAFLRACKVSQIEGQIRYANAEQFLAIVGLGPLAWTNDAGVAWVLNDLWRWLGQRHMTATRRHNGLTVVESRRWDDWQTRRSDAGNTTPKRRDASLEKESEKEKEINPPTPLADFERFDTPPPAALNIDDELRELLTADPSTLTASQALRQIQPWRPA